MFNILVPIKTISLSFLLILHNVTIIYYFGDIFSVSISPSDLLLLLHGYLFFS
jgi:hypothetical protein